MVKVQRLFAANKELLATERVGENAELRARIAGIDRRLDLPACLAFAEREAIQEDAFKLPALPTTTPVFIPQTTSFKVNVWPFRKGELSQE